jgi:hypothetical protein
VDIITEAGDVIDRRITTTRDRCTVTFEYGRGCGFWLKHQPRVNRSHSFSTESAALSRILSCTGTRLCHTERATRGEPVFGEVTGLTTAADTNRRARSWDGLEENARDPLEERRRLTRPSYKRPHASSSDRKQTTSLSSTHKNADTPRDRRQRPIR